MSKNPASETANAAKTSSHSAPEPAAPPTPDEAKRDATPQPDTTSSQGAAPAPRGGQGATLLATAAALIALGAAGTGYYLWAHVGETRAELRQLEARLATRSDALAGDTAALRSTDRHHDAVLDQVQRAISEADARHSQLLRAQEGLGEAVRGLREQMGRDESDWTVSEVAYLLRIANHRLQLSQDIDSAIAALEAADRGLAKLGDPAYLPVREAIAIDLQRLGNLERLDRAGVAMQLGGVADSVSELPLAEAYRVRFTERPTPQQPAQAPAEPAAARTGDWKEFVGGIWSDLKALVVIRRGEEATRPLLSPREEYFLRENLRLKLETARLALLERDAAVYGATLAEAGQWAREHFNTEAAATRNLLETLQRLQGVVVAPTLPDISDPLRRLRGIQDTLARRATQGRAATPKGDTP